MRFSTLLLTSLYIGAAQAIALQCSDLKKSQDCNDLDGCKWQGGSCEQDHISTMSTCNALDMKDCEDNELCMKVKNKCVEVNRGTGTTGADCAMTLEEDDSGNPVYSEVDTLGCDADYVCLVADSYSNTTVGAIIPGTCQPSSCFGNKVAGRCNGNDCGGATNRTTICHRTCSETNPWVRITIDDDAWKTCGHQQHSITDCNGKNLTKWGANTNDYLIKVHGTRTDVANALDNNTTAIKQYWRKWEHACPSVRNGECCDWTDENPCCGDKPPGTSTVAPVPSPTPAPVPGPTPTPGDECPEDQEELYAINGVKVMKVDELGNFESTDDFPVKVLSTDRETVTFEVCNKLGGGRVFTGFVRDGEYVCEESELPKTCETYTADCYHSQPFSVVDIYLTEPGNDDPLIMDVPKCCHDNEVEPKAAAYVFLLKCECPAETE